MMEVTGSTKKSDDSEAPFNEWQPDPYLTASEMKALTGSSMFRSQIRALKEMGWPYFIDAHGRPKLSRKYHDAKMSGEPVKPISKKEPNWSKPL